MMWTTGLQKLKKMQSCVLKNMVGQGSGAEGRQFILGSQVRHTNTMQRKLAHQHKHKAWANSPLWASVFSGVRREWQHLLGHLTQRADSLEKTLMLGKTEGWRTRGRQRWGILDSMDASLSKLRDTVKDREAGCAAVQGAAAGHDSVAEQQHNSTVHPVGQEACPPSQALSKGERMVTLHVRQAALCLGCKNC